MTLEQVKKFYGSSYKFYKITGMPASNFYNWKEKGFIPIKSQMRLEELTKGKLKASLTDLKWE